MKLIVDQIQRKAKMRAHTATHLLHAEINKIIPTKQAWSLVDEDYLRFDFLADNLLNPTQLRDIEININEIIKQDLIVNKQEMWFVEATWLWAKAFFEEKYWDKVRVISINEEWNHPISIELCGWTHLSSTWEIWIFKIIWHEAVASWTKRLIAITWTKVFHHIIDLENANTDLANTMDCNTKQLPEKIKKLKSDYDNVLNSLSNLQIISTKNLLTNIIAQDKKTWDFEYIVEISSDNLLSNLPLKTLSQIITQNYSQNSFCFYWNDWSFLIYHPTKNLKDRSKEKWLRGGWNENLIMWKDEKISEIV